MKIHITNNLGSNAQANKSGTTIRQSRERSLEQVLDALNDHWQGVEVVLWNQQPYQPKHRNVRVIDTLPQPVAAARNEILRNFYASDDDWCAIFDNDSGAYHDDKDRLDSNEFIADPSKLLNQLTGKVAAFSPFDPVLTPYTTLQDKKAQWLSDYKNNWVFKNSLMFRCQHWHSNYRKIYNKEFYYDESLDVWEDVDFAIQLQQAGLFVGKLQNYFMKEYSNKSTIFKVQPTIMTHNGKMDWDDRDDRNGRGENSKRAIEKKWSKSWEDILKQKSSDFRLVKPNSKFAQLFEEVNE
jgi:hypothetical protein